MSTAELIEQVLQAPEDRRAAILAAARGTAKPTRTGTIRQAAAIVGCCPRSIERYSRMGLLRQIRITARKVRYDLDECERLATRGAAAAQGEARQ
jgi:hypothetical protein